MINRNDQNRNSRQVKGWRRLLAWLCALMLLISSSGVTAFADSDGIYSAPVTAPANQVQQTPAPDEPEGEPAEGEPAEGEPAEGEPEEGENPEEDGETEEEQIPDQVYEPGTLTAETEGCSFRIDFTENAHIPEGAVLNVSLVRGADLYTLLKTAARLVKYEESEAWSCQVSDENNQIYALTMTDAEGNDIQPASGMTLSYTNPDSPDDVIYCITGDNERLLELADGSLTIEGYLLEPFGYTALEKVQVGTVTLEYAGNDYTVTAAYGPEAGFPADTELKVREIQPGTTEYALYSGMTEEALDEEWKEITLERYFDITFVSGDRELEPQADVDVQILFKDTIELTEEHDVQAVHIENNEANVIEADTDSNGAAQNDSEAIDTVTFTSGSFSVFGVVQRKKITQKVLAADGQTYEIEVTYGPEAEIPEGAVLKVEEIPEGSDLWEAYRKQTAAALGADDVRLPGLYDITILDAEGSEVEPKAPINVSITLANADSEEQLHVVHFTEEMPEEQVAAAAEEKTEEQTEALPLPEEEQISSEKIDANVDGNTVIFETEGFSVYAFAYAVVYYFKTASGETYLIRLDYDAESGIPVGSVLNVEEILPEDARYAEYLGAAIRAAKKAGEEENAETGENTEPEENAETDGNQETEANEDGNELIIPEDQYARFFDIEIRYNGEKIEPSGNISVTIQLADAPEDRLEELKVIHFADAGTQVLDAEITAEAIQFDTETFSVYAVVTIPDQQPIGVNDLNGMSFTIKRANSNYYATSDWVFSGDSRWIALTSDANNASIWSFESAGTPGQYYISTTGRYNAQNGQKVYLHMQRQNDYVAEVCVYPGQSDGNWDKPRMAFTVSKDENSDVYYISYSDGQGHTYYLNDDYGEGAKLNGYVGGDGNCQFEFGFNNSLTLDEGPYVLVSAIEGAKEDWVETWNASNGQSVTTTEHYTKVVNGHAVMANVVPYNGNGQDSLASTGVHVWTEEDGSSFVGTIASEWTLVWNAAQGAYNIRDEKNRYICRDDGSDSGLELTSDQNNAIPFEFRSAGDGRVAIKIKNQDLYMHNSGMRGSGEWQARYYTVYGWEDRDDYKFWLCKKSADYDTLSAGKISAANLAANQEFIIYRRFTHDDGSEDLFAIATDGSMVRVFDGGDMIYWRETDKNIYWNYQYSEGHNLFKSGDGTTCISPSASSGQTIAGHTGLTMLGKDDKEYGSTIECWDQASYDYAGLHVTEIYNSNNEVVGAELSAGTRKEGTSDEFFFAVVTTYPGDTAEQVATVDSAALGIKITMYDYGTGTEVTAGQKLEGMTSAVGGNDLYNPHAAQSLVSRYLDPDFGLPISGAGVMSGLFGSGGIVDSGTVIPNVNHLFVKSYYDANGTFRYRSEDNYAYLDGNQFKVYRQVATPYTEDIAVGRPYYYHGHFMPFNDIDTNNKLSRLLDQYGVGELDVGDGRSYEAVYGIQGTPDYYHGMKMEANFTQPRDGKLENNNDMIFKFTGDDDMWVFIDGVLVLDIGGIHEPLSGSIDFSTGIVKNPAGTALSGKKTLYEIFRETKNSAPQDVIDRINAIQWKDVDGDGTPDTFADYTSHTFSSFYMERGAGASNLDIQFNLKVARKNEFIVRKKLPEGADPKYINQTYTFQATYADGSPMIPGDTGNCINVVYQDRRDAFGQEVPVSIDENGYFTLEPGEAAVFELRDETVPYNIREINIDSNLIEKVTINGEEQTPEFGFVESGSATAYNRKEVEVTNYPKMQNLLITKHLLFNTELLGEDQPVFEFRVYMESEVETADGPEQKLIPYAQRPYYLVREEEGVLYYYTLTSTDNAPENQGTTPVICSSTGNSGSINCIPPEYTVMLPDIAVGTNFYVEEYTVRTGRENTGMPDGYMFVRSETEDCDDSDLLEGNELSDVLIRPTYDTNTAESGVSGKIIKGTDAHVHVYNGKKTTVNVKKNWNKGDVVIPGNAYVMVTLGRYKLTDDPANVWTISFSHGEGSGTMESQTVIKGKQYRLPECGFTAPEGKVFAGWNLGAPGKKIDIFRDTTLTALWEAEPVEYCTVSFSANGGSGSMESLTVPKGSFITLPANGFTAPQYSVFTGWDQGNANESIQINENTLIKAQWELTGFNVRVNVRNVPEGANIRVLLQEKGGSYTTFDSVSPNAGAGNSSYLLHADNADGNYQLEFGPNGSWDNPTFSVSPGMLYNYSGNNYNVWEEGGNPLINGKTYTINCITSGSGNNSDNTITFAIDDVQWLRDGWFETGAVDDASLEMLIKCEDRVIERVTLNKDNKWKATVTLPKKDQNENDYQYYLDFVYSAPLTGVRAEYPSFAGKDHATKLILTYSMNSSSSERQEKGSRSLLDYFLPRAYAEDANVYLAPAAPPLPNVDGKIWVKDDWEDPSRIIRLDGSNEWSMEDLPFDVADDEGNLYVYYIDEVHEYNMPNPSEWSVERDNGHLLVWGDHMAGGEHEEGTLSLTNTIKGHISITKTNVVDDEADGETIETENVFTFEVMDGSTVEDTLIAAKGHTDTSVDLELGKTYKIVETDTGGNILGYEFNSVELTQGGTELSEDSIYLSTNETVVVSAVNHYTRKHKYIPVHDDVTFRKVNEDESALLEGATFTLYDGVPGASGTNELGTYTDEEFTISTRDEIIRQLFGYTAPAAAGDGEETVPEEAEAGAEGDVVEETDVTEAAEHGDVIVYLKETIAPPHRQPVECVYAITIHKVVDAGTTPNVEMDAFVTTITYTMTVTDGENTFSGSVNVPNPVETVDLAVDKQWFQNGTQLTGESYLPDAEITVKLQQSTDGGTTWVDVADSEKVLKKTDYWSTSWPDLPGFEETVTGGTAELTEIRYQIVETAVKINNTDGTVTLDPAQVVVPEDPDLKDEDETLRATLTNDLPTTDVTVKKTWNHGSVQWPEGYTVIMTLKAAAHDDETGEDTEIAPAKTAEAELNAENFPDGYTWNDLPVYTEAGQSIAYTVEETEIQYNNGETTVVIPKEQFTIDGTGTLSATGETTYDNTPKTTERHAEKVWEDANDALGLRDAITGITFTLRAEANNESVDLVTYGFDASFANQTFTTESQGWPAVTADWEGLPMYTREGYEITYGIDETMTADEEQTNEYTTIVSDLDSDTNIWTVTNKLGTASVELGGTKTMKGGETPQNIYTFELSAEEGTPMPAGGTSPVTVNNSGGTFSFGSILYKRSDMTDATLVDGSEDTVEKTFTYTIRELQQLNLEEGAAEPEIEFDTAEYTVTVRVERNTATGEMSAEDPVYIKTAGGSTITEGITEAGFENEELTEVEVTKLWSSRTWDNPPAGTTVTLMLYKGTVDAANKLTSVVLDGTADTVTDPEYEYEGWKAKWTKLPKYEDGTEITYVVKETPELDGYTVTYGPNGYEWVLTGETITNTLNETDLKIVKVDANGMMQELTGALFTLTKVDSETKEPIADVEPITIDLTSKSSETVQKLTDGTYSLWETQAPAGFIGMSAPIIITITDGAVQEPDLSGTTTILYSEKSGETPATMTIGNTPGTELPSTGGSGTAIYTAGGLALALLAGVLLISRRKRRNS